MADFALQRFRRLTGQPTSRKGMGHRPPIPARDKLVVALLLLNVFWLFVVMGGVRPWGQLTAAAIALLSLFVLPSYEPSSIPFGKRSIARFLRNPLFWSGFGLFIYISIQSYNVSWDWIMDERGRQVLNFNPNHIRWLPAGIPTPMESSNPFRQSIFYLTPWISAALLWSAVISRRGVTALCHGIAIIGCAFAVLALYQFAVGAEKILGIFESPKPANVLQFWGTLVNENHAAFFLILINGLCLGLFLQGWANQLRRFQKGGGIWLLYFGLAFLCSFSALMAQARWPIILLVIQWIIFVIICSVFFLRNFGMAGLILPIGFVGFIGVMGMIFIINPNVYERQKVEWERTVSLVENPELEARYFMFQITSDMIADKPWLGHGAGSFRFTHLPYLRAYPEFKMEKVRWIRNPETGKGERKTFTTWFNYAHVDLHEYLLELGFVGCLFLFPPFFLLFIRPIFLIHGWDFGIAMIYATNWILLLGAIVEFHLRIPLVLLTWVLLSTACARLITLKHHLIKKK